ncbi:MAG: acetylornithine transaminase [Thermodesulfobacteriota bacterium]|nr:acetylornithine transaminase [Thermodesulfobacteriota bacterium]
MKEQTIKEKADMVFANTYKRIPLLIESGAGCTVKDETGRAYTDFIAGIAVCNLGHAHPAVVDALCDQAKKLFHVSNLYYTTPQTELAAHLVEKSFADRVFFCNSGAEANEAAIKLARKYFSDKGETGRYRIIAMDQSFHGRTMGTLSATGQDKIKKGFEPLLEGFDFVPFNDIEALRAAMTAATCAVMLEPVQGEGGVVCSDPDYLAAVRKLCNDHGALLIFDEVQTGIGRTGKLFAHEHYNVRPDIMTLAKALGNGLPIGAMLATETAAAAFAPGTHATTFGGTPVICAAALAVLKTIENEDVLAHCREMGDYFRTQLTALKKKHACIQSVRGAGLLLGLVLIMDGAPVVSACLEKGYMINCIQEKVLRFAPPLIISQAEIDGLVACLDAVLADAVYRNL